MHNHCYSLLVMLRPVRFITFDLYETCLYIKGSLSLHYKRVAERHGVHLLQPVVEENFRAVYRKFCTEYPNYGQGVGMESGAWWHKVAFKTLILSIRGQATHLLDQLSWEIFEEFKDVKCWGVYPDAAEFLLWCHKNKVSVAGVSNFDERLTPLLEKLEIRKYFKFVLDRANKPETNGFIRALKRSGFQPSDSCHVGNSVKEDCVPAISVGMRPVLLNRSESEGELNEQLHSAGLDRKDVVVIQSLSMLQEKLNILTD